MHLHLRSHAWQSQHPHHNHQPQTYLTSHSCLSVAQAPCLPAACCSAARPSSRQLSCSSSSRRGALVSKAAGASVEPGIPASLSVAAAAAAAGDPNSSNRQPSAFSSSPQQQQDQTQQQGAAAHHPQPHQQQHDEPVQQQQQQPPRPKTPPPAPRVKKPRSAAHKTSTLAKRDVLLSKMMKTGDGGLTPKHFATHQIGSVEDWNAKVLQRIKDREACNAIVIDPNVPGVDKMHARCEYYLKYGKTLFSCPNCWLLPGFCVCARFQTFTPRTKVVVHVHHLEWGKASNTGCVIHRTVTNSEMLIKGHKDHEAKLNALFDDSSVTTAVLWPGDESISPTELKTIAQERTDGRIAVVAVDGTWSTARSTKAGYPKGVLHVKLSPESALLSDQTRSLLYPVRKYKGDLASTARVSTLEAVAALLYELEGDETHVSTLHDNLRIKVDACRIQKNLPAAYGTLSEEDLIQY